MENNSNSGDKNQVPTFSPDSYVFPVKSGAKTPLVKWKQQSSNDRRTIEAWAAQYPGCNWAVDCGKSGIIVIDVDLYKPEAQESWLNLLLTYGGIPATRQHESARGGAHYIFKGNCGSVNGIAPGIDIKAKGGYVLIPPSTFDGKRYSCTHEIDICEVPEWVPELVGVKTAIKTTDNDIIADSEFNRIRAIDYLVHEAPEAIEGQHGDTDTFKVVCELRDYGLPEDVAVDLMSRFWNDKKAFPPWSFDELKVKVGNAYRYAGNPIGALSPEALFEPVEKETTISGFEDLSEWALKPPPPVEWIFQNLIARRTIGCIFARGGTGKSYFLMLILLCAIMGRVAFDLFNPTKPLRVLAALIEDPRDVTRTRLWHVGAALGIDQKQLQEAISENLFLRCDPPGALMQFDRSGNPVPTSAFKWLHKQAEQIQPDLIILDPKAYLFGLDENSNDHNTIWLNQLKKLTQHGAGVLFTHHSPKDAKGFDLAGMRGGGALADACRFAMGMQIVDNEKAREMGLEPGRYVAAKVVKNSYAAVDCNEYLFRRGPNGELTRVDFKTALGIADIAELIAQELGRFYESGGADLTKRQFLKDSAAKVMRNNLKKSCRTTNKGLSGAVEFGIERGILFEVTGKNGRQVTSILKPGHGGPDA